MCVFVYGVVVVVVVVVFFLGNDISKQSRKNKQKANLDSVENGHHLAPSPHALDLCVGPINKIGQDCLWLLCLANKNVIQHILCARPLIEIFDEALCNKVVELVGPAIGLRQCRGCLVWNDKNGLIKIKQKSKTENPSVRLACFFLSFRAREQRERGGTNPHRRYIFQRKFSLGHFDRSDPEGPNISPSVVFFAFYYFRSHPVGSPDDGRTLAHGIR